MNSYPASFVGRKIATALLVIGSLVGLTHVHAQSVFLTFSGGGGTPLVMSWSTPIVYTITATPVNNGKDPYFVFDEVGNVYSGMQFSSPIFVTAGAPTYNGIDGTFQINNVSSGENFNSITTNDIKFRNVPDAGTTLLFTGQSFTLSAGNLTTTVNYFGTLPTDGLYATFITDASYQFMGSGNAIPEPSTYAAITGALMLGFVAWRRRQSHRAPTAHKA